MEEPSRTTLWSVVLAAADARSPDRRNALDDLVGTYWRPAYQLFRHCGVPPDEAPDVTQEFFRHFLERDLAGSADPARGRFRAYLRTCARNFWASEWERMRAQKRGGGAKVLSLDCGEAERLLEPWTDETPEKVFNRQWALDLLEGAIARLESEARAGGREALFQAVRAAFALDGPPQVPTYARIAEELLVKEQDIANFLFKARRRLREIVRERVRETVTSEEEVDEEIRDLFDALAG